MWQPAIRRVSTLKTKITQMKPCLAGTQLKSTSLSFGRLDSTARSASRAGALHVNGAIGSTLGDGLAPQSARRSLMKTYIAWSSGCALPGRNTPTPFAISRWLCAVDAPRARATGCTLCRLSSCCRTDPCHAHTAEYSPQWFSRARILAATEPIAAHSVPCSSPAQEVALQRAPGSPRGLPCMFMGALF